MTLTDCMKTCLDDGGGFDCQKCGLHVDQCVQEDNLYLQDERYKLQAELIKTKNGRALTTTAHRSLRFSDTARRIKSTDRQSRPTHRVHNMDAESTFADAPLSNARQPELKTFTFKQETTNRDSGGSAERVVVYKPVQQNNSPRFSLRTIARPVAISTTTSEESDVASEAAVGESTDVYTRKLAEVSVRKPAEIYTKELLEASVGGPAEVSVDWPDFFETGEVSVDGPELGYGIPTVTRTTAHPTFYREGLKNNRNSAVIDWPEVPGTVAYSDGFESSTSADTLSSESGEYSVFSPDLSGDLLASRNQAPPVAREISPKFPLRKSMTDINLYRLFYPNRVPVSPVESGLAEPQHVPSSIDCELPPSDEALFESVVKTKSPSRNHNFSTEKLPLDTEILIRQRVSATPTDSLIHRLTPIEIRQKKIQTVLREALATTTTATDQTDAGVLRPVVGVAKANTSSPAQANLTGRVSSPSPVRQSDRSKEQGSYVPNVKNFSVSGSAGVKSLTRVTSPVLEIYHKNSTRRKHADIVNNKTRPQRRREPLTNQQGESKQSSQSKQTTKMTSTLRYSLPPPMPGSTAASTTQIPITGSSFKTDYPTTAQFLAQQQQRDRYDRYLYEDGGGTGSPLSTATLPYTVDGTKVIYPPAVARKQAHSYASSRVSTTSELDGYPASPSPSIPDSTFSLASRGSNGRLSRRTHATIYLKGTEANIKPDSRSKVDLTVESENGVAADELRRVPDEAQQQLVARRSSSSSSSSGRGIQKLTIKMILKEKKHDSTRSLTTMQQQQPALDRPPSSVARPDDLPNGATAASTSYHEAATSTSYHKQLTETEPVRRAISSSYHNRRYSSGANSSVKPRLSSSQVELFKPEILNFPEKKMPEVHVPIYDRRPPTRDSTMSRAYSQASSSFSRDPTKPKPYRSYERLDIINDDGGRVMREVVEELRGDHISIQIHEKGDGLTKDRAEQIQNDEQTDLERLEKTRPNLEIAMTSDSDVLDLPEKPPSPGRSRREKYELYQAMSWKRDITTEQDEPVRSHTPVSFHEVEYELQNSSKRNADLGNVRNGDIVNVREETRVAESRSVSAPAPVKPTPVYETSRNWNPERQPTLPLHTSMLSSTTYSNTEHQSHISYRSIFDKCYTDERISELRKSASDLRALADGGLIRPWSTRRESLSTQTNNKPQQSTNSFKCDYPSAQPPARPLPPYREPLTTTGSSAAYDIYRPSSYAPIAPQRGSSTRSSFTPAAEPELETQYAAQTRSYTHESHSKTTTTSSSAYPPPTHVEKDLDYKYITQYKSTPTLPVATSRPINPLTSFYRESQSATQRKTEDPINKTSFAYKPRVSDTEHTKYSTSSTGYVPYVSSAIGITSLPRITTDSYSRTSDPYAPTKHHLATVEALARRTTGQPPLPRDFIAQAASVPFGSKKDPITRQDPTSKDSFTYKPRDTVTSSRYESNTTSTSSTFEKPKFSAEPRSAGSSWAYGHKLPDEQYRSTSADRPESAAGGRRDPPLKTVEPAVIEALKTKRHEPPSSPDVRPKDWVPPCKAKILQAKRKYMNQQPIIPQRSQDPWDRYQSSSRERVQLRISRESLDAINKEATRGQRTRMSAPDLTGGSMRALTNPIVYRSKIHWPEREVQAKLSESQEYLARRYNAEYAKDDDPTTSSFANRWDARSRSLPPMSRYSKSAATTPSETPYPEYMDSNKAKSMEFLADVKKFDYQIVPENQLQRENISGYARPRPSDNEYGDQVRKSLQKLDLPEWYVNSPYSQPGVMEGTILRRRAHSTTDSNYSPYATLDRSELTSPTGTFQSSDAQVLSKRTVPYEQSSCLSNRGSKPTLSTSREDKVWDYYTGPFYNKKTRPAAIYSPASETHRQQHYNPHDSGWSSDWNSHHESSQDSDESTHGESRRSPRAWNSNTQGPQRKPAPLTTSSTSAWYVPPLQRREQSEPPTRSTRTYSEQRPEENQRREPPPYVAPSGGARPSTFFDPSLSQRRVLQATPWEVTSIKTETIKTEKLAKKNFVTETNDPVKINQFSHSNSQWGSYV